MGPVQDELDWSGISISDRHDELRWTGGDCSGLITTKNVYNALATELWKNKIGGWRRNLWGWDCPQKIKLFSWLLIEDKLLTWNNLQKRGWYGPGFCHLCKGNEESGIHLFVHCPFTRTVWKKIKENYKLSTGWTGTSVKDCFAIWASRIIVFHPCQHSYVGSFG
jgi:hypothetical protein